MEKAEDGVITVQVNLPVLCTKLQAIQISTERDKLKGSTTDCETAYSMKLSVGFVSVFSFINFSHIKAFYKREADKKEDKTLASFSGFTVVSLTRSTIKSL